MKMMKSIQKVVALTAMLIGMIGWAGDSAPFLLDTTDPLIAAPITYNSSWIGGNSSAEVVISADGEEIKRTTGEGEFAWVPTTPGKHTLTYTTYIDGVVQEEVYTATVFKDWKYTVEDGKATIIETTQTSGNVTIPSEIDGYPVVGVNESIFEDCTSVTIHVSVSLNNTIDLTHCKNLESITMEYAGVDGNTPTKVYLDDELLFSSADSGTYTWIPRSVGVHELRCETGSNVLTILVDSQYSFYDVEENMPNPPGVKDETLSLSVERKEFTSAKRAAGTFSVTSTTGSGTWSASASEEWISLTKTSGSVSDKVSYIVEANASAQARVGYVYVSGHVHTIVQPGTGVTVTPSSLNVGHQGVTQSITVDTLVDGASWVARSDDQWISVAPVSGSGDDNVNIQVAPYYIVGTREGTATIAGETVAIFQRGRDMELANYSTNITSTAQSVLVDVSAISDVTWSIVSGADWITVSHVGSGLGSSTVDLTIAENTSFLPRTATVAIGTEVFTITQYGATSLILSISESDVSVPATATSAKTLKITATPDLPWKITSNCNWLAPLNNCKTGDGTKTVAYSVAANPTLAPRSGKLTFTPDASSGLQAKILTVTQAAAVSSIDSTSASLTAAATTVSVEVTVDPVVNWSVSSSVGWVTIDGSSSRTGAGTVELRVSENTSLSARNGTVTIAGHTYTIRQAGGKVGISSSSSSVVSSGGTLYINVTGSENLNWSIQNAVDWVTIEGDVSHTGPATLVIRVEANTGTEDRKCEIIIGGEKLTIEQAAASTLVEEDVLIYGEDVDIGLFSVEAPDYLIWQTFTENDDWIIVTSDSPTTGSGDVEYIVDGVDSGISRIGILWVGNTPVYICQSSFSAELSETSKEVSRLSGNGQIAFEVGEGNKWSAVSTVPWIRLANSEGEGDGFVSFEYDENTTEGERVGRIIIVDKVFTITQSDEDSSVSRWTISYENLKGASNPNPTKYDEGSEVAFLPLTGVTGYTFTGWTPSSISASDTGNKVVRANWVANNYTLKFDANGGFGEMPDQLMTYGTVTAIADNTFTRLGYQFAGWKLELSGDAVFADKALVMNLSSIPDGVVRLYAAWTPVAYNISYEDTKGAMNSNPSNYTIEDTVTFSPLANVPGYAFIRWVPESISAGTTGDITVTALWRREWNFDDLVDSGLAQIINGGSANWYKESNVTYNGGDVWRSGIISDSQSSWMEIEIENATEFSFSWKVSSESNYDKLSWSLDGVQQEQISGSTQWAEVAREITPGKHKIRFVYSKDSSVSSNDDCGYISGFTVIYPETVSVTFDLCGNGTRLGGGELHQEIKFGTAPVLPTVSPNAGWRFLGWFTAQNGGEEVTSEMRVTADMTIYARWESVISADVHEKVQLWENGPYWATTNIGAEKPEDYGYYFWWGDTVGYKRENDKWVASDGSNLNFSFEEDNTPTYDKDISTLQSEGWITSDGVLAPEHDAAHTQWGGDWRMPTKLEYRDLHLKCDWVWTAMKGIYGYIVRGRDEYASNSIFLPCAGNGNGTSLNNSGSFGNYWSSSPYSDSCDRSSGIGFTSVGDSTSNLIRNYGLSVRPVQGAICVTVTFDTCGGSSVESISIPLGQALGELPTPTRDGYKFLGWFTASEGGNAVTSESLVTADMTIYARWESVISADVHEKVQLWENGPYWATTNIGAEKPEDYGYYFWWGDTVGYKRENDKWVASDGSNSNFSFSTSNTPTYDKSDVTLQIEGWITAEGVLSSEYDAAQVQWGGSWRMPTKQELDDLNNKCDWTRTTINGVNGYVVRGRGDYASASIFIPWAGRGEGKSHGYFTQNGYCWSSVSYEDNDGDSWSLIIHSGDHTMQYYYRYYGLSIRPVQDAVKLQNCTITFDAGEGVSVSPILVPVGQSIDELPTPTRDGYNFLGWFTAAEGGDAVTSTTIVTANMTIYARWTIKSYTVVFDANGGGGGVSKSYNHGATLGEMPVPTRDGYTFTGWFTAQNGGEEVTSETVVSADMTIYAHWERIYIAVDEPVAVEGLVYNGSEQVGVAAAEGYTLSGVSAAVDAGEHTATATLVDGYKWADGSMDDKTIIWSIAKATNEWITEPKISLESWTEGETAGELTDGVAKFGEVVVTLGGAEFTALPTAPGSYTIEYSVAETGNYSGLIKFVSFEIIKYVPIISEITYENLRGAMHTNPETYQEGTVVEFTNPSAVEGYTFAGWTPERISVDMTGAQTVRANWTANNYTIAYNSNGGSGTMEPTLATYDSEVIVKNNEFIRDGYTFKGWALEEGGDVAYAPGKTVINLTAQADGVITFYAVWERILIAVDEPVAAENLIYNGTEQVGVGAADGYTLSGVIAAVDAGEYTATATLADGYKWADGSLEDKTITWSIAKAANEWITEPKISLESWTEGETAGELTDGVAKFGEVAVTINGAAFTEFPTAIGSYSIEYTVAETSNYSGLTKLVAFEIVEKPNPIPTINPDWGYIAMNLGKKKNEVAVVFTNHIEKAMTWTVPDDIENVQFLVVGGGGGGGSAGSGGGGGAGGGGVVTGMIHKLEKDSTISVVVGAGGDGGTRNSAGGLLASTRGGNSTLTIGSVGAITAYGGAKVHKDVEHSGGSGNGSYGAGKAGTATKGKVDLSVEEFVYSVESFGNNGGYGYNNSIGGGGGGAYPGDEGKGGNATKSAAGKGGAGLVSNITGEPITYGSGGGGSTSTVGASGGEGAGNGCSNKSAKANQGGGGGGAGKYSSGGKGGSGIVVIRYTIPSYLLPEVYPEVTDDSKVAAALEGSADVKLIENITTVAEYAAFREWALNLEGVTPEEVKASPNAWLSYALNTDKLIIAAPKEGDVVIDTFEIAATEGAFEFTIKINGVEVGDNALEANLKKVFDIEGAETLASGEVGFSYDNVEVNAAVPANGNVKFIVTPKMGNVEKPDSFFFRVKMK